MLAADEALAADHAVVFIGRIRSPWRDERTIPKNLAAARAKLLGEQLARPVVEIDEPYRRALDGLNEGQPIILLYWMDRAPRDLLMQTPRHRTEPAGTFSLRSPARPNPIAIARVTLCGLDIATGRLTIDAIDCFDGTPLLDIKPWLASVDGCGSCLPSAAP